MMNLSMKVCCDTAQVLERLRENCKQHSKIVEEARKGYIDKAKEVLEKRLDQLREGKIVDVIFRLTPPEDNTHIYNTAIKMLELHQGDTIDLTAMEVRQLIEDEWDWTNVFLIRNSGYSASARTFLAAKGLPLSSNDEE